MVPVLLPLASGESGDECMRERFLKEETTTADIAMKVRSYMDHAEWRAAYYQNA